MLPGRHTQRLGRLAMAEHDPVPSTSERRTVPPDVQRHLDHGQSERRIDSDRQSADNRSSVDNESRQDGRADRVEESPVPRRARQDYTPGQDTARPSGRLEDCTIEAAFDHSRRNLNLPLDSPFADPRVPRHPSRIPNMSRGITFIFPEESEGVTHLLSLPECQRHLNRSD